MLQLGMQQVGPPILVNDWLSKGADWLVDQVLILNPEGGWRSGLLGLLCLYRERRVQLDVQRRHGYNHRTCRVQN